MGPTFDAFAWLHALVVISLALIGLAVMAASGIEEFRQRQDQGRADRRQRLARLQADADNMRAGIEA